MKKIKFNAGYRLTVKSCENDADNWETHTVDGLTEYEVRFRIMLLNLITDSYSRYKDNQDGFFGNVPQDYNDEKFCEFFSKAIITLFKEFRQKFGVDGLDNDAKDIYNEIDKQGSEILDGVAVDYVVEDIYQPLCGYSEYFYTRVVDEIEVTYLPEPIEVEIEDVTSRFK